MVESGSDPMEIMDATMEAMGIVGQRYEKGTYFLPELILSGVMLNQIAEMVKPKLAKAAEVERHGKVVIGTVEGDIHDIGKDIVVFMLDVNGFDVLDLGIDVPPQKFVEAIKDFKPQVVGLSGFLNLAYDSMRDTVEAIKKAGLRDKVKIMIGGGQMSDSIREHSGADAYGKDAMAGVSLAKEWIGAK
jgi:methanogenic corrinoid protein MtbC1